MLQRDPRKTTTGYVAIWSDRLPLGQPRSFGLSSARQGCCQHCKLLHVHEELLDNTAHKTWSEVLLVCLSSCSLPKSSQLACLLAASTHFLIHCFSSVLIHVAWYVRLVSFFSLQSFAVQFLPECVLGLCNIYLSDYLFIFCLVYLSSIFSFLPATFCDLVHPAFCVHLLQENVVPPGG